MLHTPLFVSKKEIFLTGVVLFFIALFSLFLEYRSFKDVTKEPILSTKATVLNHYTKTNDKGRSYDVIRLKLDESGAEVYTTSWHHVNLSLKSRVKVKLNVSKVSFLEYLKGFYAPSTSLYTIYEDNPPFHIIPLYQWVENQHESEKAAEFYKTLFFATPISKELRDEVQQWGITHLIAISGYNVGVISFLLFFLLKPVYQFFQSRYFPYRNLQADLMPLVIVVLFVYMVMIDFVPSFLRAFCMSVLGFFFYSRGIKVLSFEMLALTTCLLLAFFPHLIFSLSFWFSVAGVFYLFLFLHHFSSINRWVLFVLIDLGVFFLMLPIVHTFFPVFTFLQLSSPLASAVFIVFYPLSLFLHLLGVGNIFDTLLLTFLEVKAHAYTLSFSGWFLAGYIGVSLIAVWYKYAMYLCLGVSLLSLFFIQ